MALFSLDVPGIILHVASYSPPRVIFALSRASKHFHAVLSDDSMPGVADIWRGAVRDRWAWVDVEDDAWPATLGSWRRAYAYLREVRFVVGPSTGVDTMTSNGPITPVWSRLNQGGARALAEGGVPADRTISLRGDRSDRILAWVEECDYSEERLSVARHGDMANTYFTLAYLQPALVVPPSNRNVAWEADVRVYSLSCAVRLGVQAQDGTCWSFDFGGSQDLHTKIEGCADVDTRRVFTPDLAPYMIWHSGELSRHDEEEPMALSPFYRLCVDQRLGTLELWALFTEPVFLGACHDPALKVADRLRIFVAFSAHWEDTLEMAAAAGETLVERDWDSSARLFQLSPVRARGSPYVPDPGFQPNLLGYQTARPGQLGPTATFR